MDIEIVKKSKAIDNLISGYSPQKVEEEKEVSPESSFDGLKEMFDIYKAHGFFGRGFVSGIFLPKINAILTPAEINSYYQSTITYRSFFHLINSRRGEFTARLINNSYQAGYNNFYINTLNLKGIESLSYFQGRPDNPLRITINGDCGNSCSREVKYTEFIFKGYVPDCGYWSENSTFVFSEIPHGTIGMASQDCLFKTTDPNTLKGLIKRVPQVNTRTNKPSGHKVILIHPDGEEELVADYSGPA